METNETYEKMLLAERRAARVLGLYPVDVCPCGRAALDGRCCASGASLVFIVTLWSPEDRLYFSRREFAYAASDAAYSALLSHRDCLVVETVLDGDDIAPWQSEPWALRAASRPELPGSLIFGKTEQQAEARTGGNTVPKSSLRRVTYASAEQSVGNRQPRPDYRPKMA